MTKQITRRRRISLAREIEAAAGAVTRMRKRCMCHGNSTGRARKMMQARLAAVEAELAKLLTEQSLEKLAAADKLRTEATEIARS